MRFVRCLSLLATVSVVSVTSALASEALGEWETVKTKRGVEVTQASVENSPFKVTRGTLTSTAAPFDVVAVLQNVSACSSWLHKCKQGKLVTKISEDESVYYTVIDAPLLLKDRETVVRSALVYDRQRDAIKITMEGAEDAVPLVKKKVRVLGFEGFWLIERLDSEQTRLTYQVHMDPQISTVRAANSTLATSVLETLINVDTLAQKAPYVNTEVPTRFRRSSESD